MRKVTLSTYHIKFIWLIFTKGLRNVQALRDVSKFQTLRYNFPFSQFSFPTDITMITLTDGKKSLICEVLFVSTRFCIAVLTCIDA